MLARKPSAYYKILAELDKAKPSLALIKEELKHCDVNQLEDKHSILDHAVAKGHIHICKEIMGTKRVVQATLTRALYKSFHVHNKKRSAEQLEITELLLKAGAEMDEEVLPGIVFWVLYDDFEAGYKLAELVLRYGAQTNVYEAEHGYNLLSMAINHFSGNVEGSRRLIALLLKYHINPEVEHTGDGGTTPLMEASLNVAKMLVEYGADITMPDYAGRTVVDTSTGSLKAYLVAQLKALYGDSAIVVKEDTASSSHESTSSKVKLTKQQTLNQALLSAAYDADNDKIKKLLAKGADINYVDEVYGTPLHRALKGRAKDASIALLLMSGANPNIANKDGTTPLHLVEHPLIAELLLAHGADVHAVNNRGESVLEPKLDNYYSNERLDLIKILINHGANPHFCNQKNETLLHKAALWAQLDVIKLLLGMGVDVNAQDIYGKTALHRAAQKEEYDAIESLLEAGADPTLVCKLGKTALDYAYTKKVKALLANAIEQYKLKAVASGKAAKSVGGVKAETSSAPAAGAGSMPGLVVAVPVVAPFEVTYKITNANKLLNTLSDFIAVGSEQGVALLIKYGLIAYAQTDEVEMTLYNAIEHQPQIALMLIKAGVKIEFENCSALIPAVEAGNVEIVKALIERKVNLEKKDSYLLGINPLLLAAKEQQAEMVKLLIAAGAKINAVESNGNTALIYAATNGNIESVQGLIAAGAKINHHNKDGVTALMGAAIGGHTETVSALIKAGAKIDAQSEEGFNAIMEAAESGHTETVAALISAGAKINARSKKGYSALMLAANDGHAQTVEALIKAGAEIAFCDSDGDNALMCAAQNNDKVTLKLLLDNKAELDIQNKSGQTALMQAALEGCANNVEALIAAGAKLNIQDKEGNTALHLAVTKRQKEVVELLLEAHADTKIKNHKAKTITAIAKGATYKNIIELLKRYGLSEDATASSSATLFAPVISATLEPTLTGHKRHRDGSNIIPR